MKEKDSSEKKETMVETICQSFRRDIMIGEVKPGEKINVKELSHKYGTSDMPVKLALNRLISEQIIENFPRQGMRVKTINQEEAKEIFELRLMMDLYYTGNIIEAVYINDALKNALKDNVEEHYKLVSRDRKEGDKADLYMENYMKDYEFHELYLKCTGNKKLVEMYKSINPFIYSNYIFQKQSRERDIEGVNEHKAIIQAILDQDEEELKRCVEVHINNAINAISIIIKANEMLGD